MAAAAEADYDPDMVSGMDQGPGGVDKLSRLTLPRSAWLEH